MEPTIFPGDFIITEKLSYGARIFTSLKFDRYSDPKTVRLKGFDSIKRNDIIVFNYPFRYSEDTIRMNLEKIFVKRCIGLPGDTVLTVGSEIPFYIPRKGESINLTTDNFKLYHKQIVYETNAVICLKDTLVYINDTIVTHYTFTENWYFMAGDNVMNSRDSRNFGLIPEEYIIGRACMTLTSKNPDTGKRRWERFMKLIK